MIKPPSGKNIIKNYEIKLVQTFKNDLNVVIRAEDNKNVVGIHIKKMGADICE